MKTIRLTLEVVRRGLVTDVLADPVEVSQYHNFDGKLKENELHLLLDAVIIDLTKRMGK